MLNQFKSRDSLKFETFDASLDEFYSKIESQRSEQQQKAKESSAMQKLNKIRTDQVRTEIGLKDPIFSQFIVFASFLFSSLVIDSVCCVFIPCGVLISIFWHGIINIYLMDTIVLRQLICFRFEVPVYFSRISLALV